MDVKSAFSQARGVNKPVYVRPPREAEAHGILLLLAVVGIRSRRFQKVVVSYFRSHPYHWTEFDKVEI